MNFPGVEFQGTTTKLREREGKFILRVFTSLRSWRHCLGARLKFWRRSRDPKKGVGTRRLNFYFSRLTPFVTASPPNLTRLLHNSDRQPSRLCVLIRPPLNVVYGNFTLWSCRDGKEKYQNSVMQVKTCC